jgi:hypothetical protein
MKRKGKTKSVRLAVLLGILSALLVERYSSPEPDTVIPPKQPPYIVYVSVCGVLEGAIITADGPAQFADYNKRTTPKMAKQEAEAIAAGRVFTFTAGLWAMCVEQPPEDPIATNEDEKKT